MENAKTEYWKRFEEISSLIRILEVFFKMEDVEILAIWNFLTDLKRKGTYKEKQLSILIDVCEKYLKEI